MHVGKNTDERKSTMCFALFAWFAQAALLAGIAKTAKGESMQRVQNTWSAGTGLCSNPRTQIYVSKQPFFILDIGNNKGLQALTANPAITFSEVVYIIATLSYVFSSNCSLNRLNL